MVGGVGGVKASLGDHLRALRAPFFSATGAAIALGAAVAYYQLGGLQVPVLLWTLAGALLAHAGANLINDYGDHLSGNDAANRSSGPFNGGSRVIQEGRISPRRVLGLALLCLSAAAAVGLSLNRALNGAWLAPGPLPALGALGLALGVLYSIGPLRLSHRGWGDAAVILGFGPVLVLGAHYVQWGTLTPDAAWQALPALLASLPIGLLTGLILFVNGFADFAADRAVGKRTWVVRLADTGSGADYRRPFAVYTAGMALSFALVAMLALTGWLLPALATPWVLLGLLPAGLAWQAVGLGRRWLAGGAEPALLRPVSALTILVHLSTGLCLTLAYLIGA